MENPEEILHSLEEFSKLKPKDIPRELEEYLCFVAKTGDPVYQWGTIKSLFREKLINVITDFYESCPSVEIPPCPNVEVFNYESMKTFILEKLDTFAAAPFTVQRICELLTTPRKEYNRIDKYMRALEKNILVVSTTEPGNRRTTENGDGIVNGLESEHILEPNSTNNDINVEEMDDTPVWSRIAPETVSYQNTEANLNVDVQPGQVSDTPHSAFTPDQRPTEANCAPNMDTVITCRPTEQPYVSIEPVASDSCLREENAPDSDVTVTITAIPAAVQKRRDSIEPVVSSGEENSEQPSDSTNKEVIKENVEAASSSVKVEISPQENVPAESESVNATDISTTTASDSDKKPIEDHNATEADNDSSSVQMPCMVTNTMPDASKDLETVKESAVTESKSDLDESSSTVKESTNKEDETPATSETTTAVTSTNEVIQSSQPVIKEKFTSDDREGSVSSTDDISNDAADVELKKEENDETEDDTDKNSNEVETPHCELSVDCTSNISSALEADETQDKQLNDKDTNNEGFASSSTSPEPMDVDISEESCQEPPTSQS